ncbi:MAG TPA: CHRD domain-containing protein [Gemmatimonadales bacterium]|nr:CHRD domain-containing protein [Gemmatimonadales bacterium]
MHSIHLKLVLTGGLLIAAFAVPAAAQTYGDSLKPQAKARTFSATLTGTHEIPQVNTIGSGSAKFTVKNDSTIVFDLSLKGVPDVTGAHIHLGAAGTAGAAVATLIQGADPGGKVSGTITPMDLHGATMSQLIAAMKSGGAYVNVHTKTHPDGEVRGEIQPAASTTVSQLVH